MKKYLLIAIVTCGLSLTACGGGQKAESQPADAAQPVVTATTDSTAAAAVNQDTTVAPTDTTAAPAAKQ